jgi:surface carbohydrate biosynthesis protein
MKKQVKEVDFMMIYEHKVRELENLCLIKYELERRGYTVEIRHIEDAEALEAVKPLYHAKVVVTMECYQNASLEWHTKDFVSFDKVIDLQWENIVYPRDEGAGVFKNYTGIGREVVRVSWGETNKRRLLESAHMDPKNIKVVGHVGMDFLRSELRGYYLSREELFQQYNLPTDKKVLLFASPFYADNLSEEYIAGMCRKHGEEWRDYYDFMMRSERTILEWMEKLCNSRDDVLVIYRPHPGHIGRHMSEVAARCDNFKVISERSVKQWIIASDIVYTGNSSTIVEAFFAGKMCHLLFPYETTAGYELKLVSAGKKIKTYEQFCQTVQEENPEFPISKEAINEIYLVDEKVPSYVKFADMAEDVLHDDSYALTKQQLSSYRRKQSLALRVQKKLQRWDWVYDKYKKALADDNCHNKWIEKQRALRAKKAEAHKRFDIESTSEEEIRGIIDKIAEQLNGGK